jgi:hypothetical protein
MEHSLRAVGKVIIWSPPFKKAMARLAILRGLPDGLPAAVNAVALRPQGVLLIYPQGGKEPDGYPLSASPQGRRVTTDLSAVFAELGADIPEGLVTEIPFTPYRSTKHGICLALQFQKATFLYKESRGSAIGLQDDWE